MHVITNETSQKRFIKGLKIVFADFHSLSVMPEVVVGHPCGLNLDSRLQTAGMKDF